MRLFLILASVMGGARALADCWLLQPPIRSTTSVVDMVEKVRREEAGAERTAFFFTDICVTSVLGAF